MFRSFILFFFILSQSFGINAQDVYKQNIRGVIVDNQSGFPLIGATIKIANTNPVKGAISNIKGEFVIENIEIGRIVLEASYIGYNSTTIQNLVLISGKELSVKIQLKEKLTNLNEVIITDVSDKRKALNKMALVSARAFTIEETKKYAGSYGDPSRMVRNFAGVGSTGDTRNDIIIRGNSPLGVLWRLEGVDIPNPNHFGSLGSTGGAISILNNNLLENSDFMTGAFAPEYGNVLSGVFDLKLRSGNKSKKEYWGQIGLNGIELGAEGPLSNKGSFIAAGRYSTLELFELIGIGLGVGATPQYKDISFKLDLPKTEKYGNITIFGILGTSFIEILQKNKNKNDQSYTPSGFDSKYSTKMGFIGFTHTYFFNKNIRDKLSILASLNTQDIIIHKLNDNKKTLHYSSNSNENKYSITYDINTKINARNVIKTGITGKYFIFNYLDSVKVTGNIFRSISNKSAGTSIWQAYVQWQHRFTENISMVSGLNTLLFSLNKSKNIEPRFAIKWQIKNNQSVSFGAGMHSQLQPSNYYFYINPDIDNSVATNINMGLSKAFHSVIKYDYNLSKDMRIRAEVYYQKLYNIPISKSFGAFSMLNEGSGFYFNLLDSLENKGTGTNYGLEFTVEKFYSDNYYFLVTSSFFQSKYKGFDNISRNTTFNGNYIINALGGYEYNLDNKNKKVLTFNIKTTLAGGKRYIPIDLEKSKEEGKEILIFEDAYLKKYKDYFRTDIRIGFKLNGKKITQEWAISIQNVTNKKNVFQRQYSVKTNKVNTEYQTGLLPLGVYKIYF